MADKGKWTRLEKVLFGTTLVQLGLCLMFYFTRPLYFFVRGLSLLELCSI